MKIVYTGMLVAFGIFATSLFNSNTGDMNTGTEKSAEENYVFDLDDLNKQRAEEKRAYLSFLNVDSMHCGVYHLAAGSKDGQQPHAEDEVYYVKSGKGKFTYGDKETDVSEGAVLFVPAKMEHRFHSIEEDLTLLVFFSKAKPKN